MKTEMHSQEIRNPYYRGLPTGIQIRSTSYSGYIGGSQYLSSKRTVWNIQPEFLEGEEDWGATGEIRFQDGTVIMVDTTWPHEAMENDPENVEWDIVHECKDPNQK